MARIWPRGDIFPCFIRPVNDLYWRCHSERSEESRPENRSTARFLLAWPPKITPGLVIPAIVGIHCIPDQKWALAFAGATA
jgi:hypothetical protein